MPKKYMFVVLFLMVTSVCWSLRQHRNDLQRMIQRRLEQMQMAKKPKPDASKLKIFYQTGTSEDDLPECKAHAVCSKVDLYDTPWIERQCRCPGKRACPSGLAGDDGHSLADKNRLYKLCDPVRRYERCRYFYDTTWTIYATTSNVTEQIVHCHCPRNSITYLTKRQPYEINGQPGYQYRFSCSPQNRLHCQRKEPCRLFSVRKRQQFVDEVNTNTLCLCPHAHRCPHHHDDSGVMSGKPYVEESIRTFSAYCIPNT